MSTSSVNIFRVYANDIVMTVSDSTTINDLKHHLQCNFDIKDLGPLKYFLGVAWRLVAAAIFWSVWKERNGRVFKGKPGNIGDMFEKAKWHVVGWLSLCKDIAGLSPEDFYLSGERCM